MVNAKIQCTVYLDPKLHEEINKSRGLIKKSTYLEHLIQKTIKEKNGTC